MATSPTTSGSTTALSVSSSRKVSKRVRGEGASLTWIRSVSMSDRVPEAGRSRRSCLEDAPEGFPALGAAVHGDDVPWCIALRELRSGVHLTVPDVHPGARGQVGRPRGRSRGRDRADEQVCLLYT